MLELGSAYKSLLIDLFSCSLVDGKGLILLPGSKLKGTSLVALVVKNPPANAGDEKDIGFNPWVRKIP